MLLEQAGLRLLIVKGAPENLLRLSVAYEVQGEDRPRPLSPQALAEIEARFEALGREGFRVLGIASRPVGPERVHAEAGDETQLVFAGFAAFLDPPKASARLALQDLAADQVQVKIVTGDSELVTQHLCAQLGLEVTGVMAGAPSATSRSTS